MTRQKLQGLLLASATFGVLVISMQTANAGGIAIREQSASGQGMSFAGEGTSSMGLSAMFWNPAAVTQTNGMDMETHLSLFFPSTEIHTNAVGPLSGSSGNIGEFAYIPTSYFAYKINPNWYVGLSITAPYGSGTHPNTPWAGSIYTNEARLKTIDFNPVIGYKFNEQLSIAAGPRILWAFNGKFNREPLLPASAATAGYNSLSDVAFGWSAGLTYKPLPGTEIALGYKSRVNLTLDGDFFLPAPIPGAGKYSVSGGATTPDQVNLGIKQRIDDRWTALASVEWTNWSVLQNIVFSGVPPLPGANTITFNYRDGWFFAGGLEYKYSAQTTLRGGIAYEISPVTDRVRDVSIPDDNRWWFSLGATHQIDRKWTMDLGYSFVWLGNSPINYVPGHPDFPSAGVVLVGTSKTYDHIVSLALRYHFDSTPAPTPIIAK
jgi:long-chain fatty acid transport protein